MPSAKFCNAQSLIKFVSKSFAFFKNHDQFLPNLKLKFSILINIYVQDYEVVNITWQSKSRWRHSFHCGDDRPAKPHNSTECRQRRLCRQLVIAIGSPAPLGVGDMKVSAAVNVGQRQLLKDGEIQPDEYTVASSNRRFSSPSGVEGDIRVTSAGRRLHLEKESRNGQLWSGRRLNKLVCRHIVLT